MKVSVITPTYNSASLVVEAIESVLAQTLPAAEVIVVDDGSTDDTADRVARFGDRVRYIRQENARVAAARNTGLRASTGDVVAFLDADDVWHPRKLELQTKAMAAHPNFGLMATRAFWWPADFPPVCEGTAAVTDLPAEDLLVRNQFATSTVAVRRSVLDQVGEFDPELFGPEDYDLWLRCSRVTSIGILEEALTGYRDTPASLGKQAETMDNGLRRIHAKLAAAGVWDGRPCLRRKSEAYVDFTSAISFYQGGRPGRAARLLLHSLWRYPVPMLRENLRHRCARVRLLARVLVAYIGGRARS